MENIKITIEKSGEVSTLNLKTDKSLFDIIDSIGKIIRTEEENVASFIEKQLLLEGEDRYIYESPDNGTTIYRRKLGETKREVITKNQFKTETRHDMGGSYEVSVENSDVWKCSYCGNGTYEVDSDYLVGFDHLSCVLKYDREEKEKR